MPPKPGVPPVPRPAPPPPAKRYIAIGAASRLSGFTEDHLDRLCRLGELECELLRAALPIIEINSLRNATDTDPDAALLAGLIDSSEIYVDPKQVTPFPRGGAGGYQHAYPESDGKKIRVVSAGAPTTPAPLPDPVVSDEWDAALFGSAVAPAAPEPTDLPSDPYAPPVDAAPTVVPVVAPPSARVLAGGSLEERPLRATLHTSRVAPLDHHESAPLFPSLTKPALPSQEETVVDRVIKSADRIGGRITPTEPAPTLSTMDTKNADDERAASLRTLGLPSASHLVHFTGPVPHRPEANLSGASGKGMMEAIFLSAALLAVFVVIGFVTRDFAFPTMSGRTGTAATAQALAPYATNTLGAIVEPVDPTLGGEPALPASSRGSELDPVASPVDTVAPNTSFVRKEPSTSADVLADPNPLRDPGLRALFSAFVVITPR